MTAAFTALHVHRTHAFEVDAPLARAFAFFEPEGERAWAQGWDPRYLHPVDGTARAGMAFTTDHGGEETLWTMVTHEPGQGIVEYARLTPGSRLGTVRVQCAPLDAARTQVKVTYVLTALTESGNATLREFDRGYETFIASWGEAIGRVLSPR